MEVCFFLIGERGHGRGAFDRANISRLQSAAHDVAGLRRFVLHFPAGRDGHDASAPFCVTQWYFDDLERLEAALQPGSAIQSAADSIAASMDACTLLQQAMAVRHFPTPHALDARDERCTYLVSYDGEADDFNAWLTHYLTHHPPLMTQLPGIRELEIYTRIDYRSALNYPRATAMQRNKVVFDDAASLDAALASPVRARMKADFDSFPPYSGATPHYPMHSIYGNLTRE
ncbi:Ethyl tert-butyl ether degradation protein EthD [Paraburkholderia caribensis]|uniref:EthD family reductase n=1 Tax=Paraburkholderia caribensis TaxID=75105 RepID=UPI001CB53912|nr:EthD family reductase [Paraburkholderia caribensis]CAG9197061.1 Ethyl tert-butyl ether degradation protein EthD [Paraburkholderia caribensis]